MHAAEHEFAGKMHDDLIDGVEWAVAQGIADPGRVGIYGGSYGGYAALVGVTFTPDVFAAAVSYVGPSSLVTLARSFPAYWRPLLASTWFRYVGDPEDPDDLADMQRRSPLNFVDRITTPLLVIQGANDPRVTKQESDQIVAALRGRGVPVDYICKDDEGHGFVKPENRLDAFGAIERFFAAHLGGRQIPAAPRPAPPVRADPAWAKGGDSGHRTCDAARARKLLLGLRGCCVTPPIRISRRRAVIVLAGTGPLACARHACQVPVDISGEGALSKKAIIAVIIAAIVVAGVVIGIQQATKSSTSDATYAKKFTADYPNVAQMLNGIPQNGQVLGDAKAPIGIIEYMDYKCPVCGAASHNLVPLLIQDYVRTGKATIELRPVHIIQPGNQSETAALAGLATAPQNRMWYFTELVLRNQGDELDQWLTNGVLNDAATTSGVNIAQWNQVNAGQGVAIQFLNIAN